MQGKAKNKKQTVAEDHCCPICLDAFLKPMILRICGHLFCQNCLQETAIISGSKRCPLCRTTFGVQDIRPEPELSKLMQKIYPQSLKRKKEHLTERVIISLVIGNTTEVLETDEDNKYIWTLYVKSKQGEDSLKKYGDSVEIELDETFDPWKLKYKVRDNSPVNLRRLGWGTFRVGIVVHWKKDHFNEKTSTFYHDLQFDPVHENVVSTYLTVKKK